MKILIIGNGAIGNSDNKRFYINNHTGRFLKEVNNIHNVLFVQNISIYNKNNDLQNFDLIEEGVDFSYIKNNKSFSGLVKLIGLLLGTDYVYAFFPGTLSRISAILAIVLRKKLGLYVRGQYFLQNPFDKIILRNSKFILTVSPFFKNQLINFCSNVEVIRPMLSIKKEDINYLREYTTPQKWNLLFVGRVEYRKGIEELLQIAIILKEQELSFELNIVGGGNLYEEKYKQIKKQELSDFITLHGQVSDKQELIKLYLNANAFIFTSHDEGFPRVLYEAMAQGLPIFTTFVGGIPGRMINGHNCIEIPVNEPSNAARIILEELNNLKRLEKIGKKGQETLLGIIDGHYKSHEALLIKNLE